MRIFCVHRVIRSTGETAPKAIAMFQAKNLNAAVEHWDDVKMELIRKHKFNESWTVDIVDCGPVKENELLDLLTQEPILA